VTRGRVVYVGRSAAVAVVDGAHQQLRTGVAVIDARSGPGLLLEVAGDALSVPMGSATEAQRSVSVRVGSLAGPAEITSATAQRLTVPGLGQAIIDGDALPATTTPLHLSDDAAETAVVPTLVSDDVALNGLARGIDSSGGAAAGVIETAWNGTTSVMPRATPSSERVLPMVIADATAAAGGTRQQRYDHVVRWRRAGGSWGVIVALLRTHAGAVAASFNALQRHQPTGQIGTVSIQALAGPKVRAGQPTSKPTHESGGSSRPTTHPRPTGGNGGTPTPSTSPVTKVVKTVKGVVGTVLGLLPVKAPPAPIPLPTPTGGLLGGN
jgi:hypothetical protein